MGLKLFSDGPVATALPNPNPHRFKIVKVAPFGSFTVCRVHYPDSTTYGGDKVLVYRATNLDLARRRELDPHFLENGFSPIAK